MRASPDFVLMEAQDSDENAYVWGALASGRYKQAVFAISREKGNGCSDVSFSLP